MQEISKFHPKFLTHWDDNAHFQEHLASWPDRKWPILPSEKDYKQAWLLAWGSCRFANFEKRGISHERYQ